MANTEMISSQFELIAKQRWNESADEFNQWEELGGDERSALIAAAHADACRDEPQNPTGTD